MLQAVNFEILRGVEANGRIALDLPRKPVRVATLIDEAAFNDGNLLIHNGTVFLEDRTHDWDWRDGKFRYYTRVAKVADVVVVYEELKLPWGQITKGEVEMKTVMDLVKMVRQGRQIAVEFGSLIERKDDCYPEGGMRAKIVRASEPDTDGVIKIEFDFEAFGEHNKSLERANYYGKQGNPTLTVREAGMYKPVDDIYFDDDEELEGLMQVLDDSAGGLYEAFKLEGSPDTYVQWLERKVLAAQPSN